MDFKGVYAVCVLFVMRIHTILSSAPCDVQMWYLNMQVSNRFPPVLNDEQRKVKKLIETIVKYGDGKATFDCDILKSYEQLFEQDTVEVAGDTGSDQNQDDVIFVSDLKKEENIPEKNLKNNQEKINNKGDEPPNKVENKTRREDEESCSIVEECSKCRTKRENRFSNQRCHYVSIVQKKPKKKRILREPSLKATFSFNTNLTRYCKFSILKRRLSSEICLYFQLWHKRCSPTEYMVFVPGKESNVPPPALTDAAQPLKNKISSLAGESKTDTKTTSEQVIDNGLAAAETLTKQEGKLVENADALAKANELLKRKNLEYAAKMSALETQVVRLENMILQKQLLKETDSSATIKMENQLLRLEKELMKVSQEYNRLKLENERLNQQQTQLTVRQDKTSSEHRYEVETLNSYQARLKELSDHVKKQTNQMMLLNAKSSLLEQHNLVLQEMVLNQSQVIASLTGQVENIVQKRIREEMERVMKEAFERGLGAKEQSDSPTVTVCGVTDGQKETGDSGVQGTHEKKENLSKAGPLLQTHEATDTISGHKLDKTEGNKNLLGGGSNEKPSHQNKLPSKETQPHKTSVHEQQQKQQQQQQRKQQQHQKAQSAPNQHQRQSKEQKTQHHHKTQQSQPNEKIHGENQNQARDLDLEQGPVKQQSQQQNHDGVEQVKQKERESHEQPPHDRDNQNQVPPMKQIEKGADPKIRHDKQQTKPQQPKQHQQQQTQQQPGEKQQLKQQQKQQQQQQHQHKNAHAQTQDKDQNQKSGEQKKQETKTKPLKEPKVVEGKLAQDGAKNNKMASAKVQTKKKTVKKAASQKAVFPEVPLYHNAERDKPKDCHDVFSNGRKRDSAYEIVIHDGKTMRVFCDMKNGGWTVIQRRTEGTTDFARSWSEYKEGFGGSLGDHWLGNDNIHYITNSDDYSLRIELTSWNRETFYAEYSRFRIEDEEGGYRLHLEGYHGNAGDAMSKHNLEKFSTYDRDNDKAVKEFDGSCAKRFSAGWWYYKCYKANLNGKYYQNGAVDEGRYDGISWKPLKPPTYSFKKVTMKIIPREAITS